MNQYSHRVREYWMRWAPTRYAQLESPDEFFEELGELISDQIYQLACTLEGRDLPDEGYLEKVARLTNARRRAEEIVMADVEWPPVVLSPDEDREEWEWAAQDVNEERLADWAWDLDGERLYQNDLEEVSAFWMLPESFIADLAAAPNPWTFMSENAAVVAASRDRRYGRFCAERAAAAQ